MAELYVRHLNRHKVTSNGQSQNANPVLLDPSAYRATVP